MSEIGPFRILAILRESISKHLAFTPRIGLTNHATNLPQQGANVKLKAFQATAAVVVLGTVAQDQLLPELSQYAPLSVSREPTLGESSIELEIRRLLRALPYFGTFDHLAYSVHGSAVTLSGQVLNPELRNDAQSVVLTVPGVLHVNNEIRFLKDSPAENEKSSLRSHL